MNGNYSMCEFRESKQQAFDEVCCAFAFKENMTEIASQCGMSDTLLRNKLNPSQKHVLTPVDLVLITKASGNYTILNSLLFGLGVVTAQLPEDEDAQTLLHRVLEHSSNAGDLSSLALEHCGGDRLTRTTKQTLIQKAQSGISNLVLLINDIENRTTGVTPLLSMSVDFIANGAPLPGLM